MIAESAIRSRFEALAPVLDERALRRFAAAKAQAAGRNSGIATVSRITGIARSTIDRGLKELDAPPLGDPIRGLRLVFLPPYSPELQPAETLWKPVDKQAATLEELAATISAQCVALTERRHILKCRAGFHWWPKIAAPA